MAITQEITRIQGAKADIKTAIEAKGVTVPSNALIDTYDDYVAAIPSGGGGNKMGQFVDVDPSATYSGNYAIRNFIEEVVVPEGITEISYNVYSGFLTFANFGKLKSVSLPSTLTSIGQSAFDYCSSLTTINIPNGVTNIGAAAFRGCTSLSSVTIPSGVTSIGNETFDGCSSLTTINISSGVTSIGNSTFRGCTSLSSVTIPSSVTSFSVATFQGCRQMTSFTCEATTPPTFGTAMFAGNTALTHIYVPAASVNDYKAASGWSDYASIIEAIPSN